MDDTEVDESIERSRNFAEEIRKARFWHVCALFGNSGLLLSNCLNFYSSDNDSVIRWVALSAVLIGCYGVYVPAKRLPLWHRRYRHACHLHNLMVEFSRMRHASASAIEMQHDQIMAAFERLS